MKKREIYGFTVTDKNGLGFTRYFNGDDSLVTDNPEGKLPPVLKRIYVAQLFLRFKVAYGYCKKVAQPKHGLQFKTITLKDWNAIQHPVKRFFNKIFRR